MCAGAREVILGSLASAAAHPFVSSNKVSGCIITSIGSTSSGDKLAAPSFKCIFAASLNMSASDFIPTCPDAANATAESALNFKFFSE